jgi:hypothetical protein
MQFQRALIGGLLGGVIGVAVLVASRFLLGVEHAAMAIVVALAVGIGVRSMVATRGHASYARGALAGLLAILAFLGGELLVVEIVGKQAVANREPSSGKIAPPPSRPLEGSSSEEIESGDESVVELEQPATDASAPTAQRHESQEQTESRALHNQPRPANGAVAPPRVRRGLSKLDYLLLCVAAFVAYELGRGSGTKAPAEAKVDPPASAAG